MALNDDRGTAARDELRAVLFAIGALLGLILGFVGYARLGPEAVKIDVGIQAGLLLIVSVLLAATAGAAGAVFSATIGARVARASREEARQTRFTDRARELAAQLLVSGERYRAGVIKQASRSTDDQAKQPLNLGATLRETERELRLILRSEAAYRATIDYVAAVEALMQFVYDNDGEIPPPELGNRVGLRFALGQVVQAADTFETAIRLELGGTLPPEPED